MNNDIENLILNEIEKQKGFTSKIKEMLKANISLLSPTFITSVLCENISLRTEGIILLEYLPYIFNINNNSDYFLDYIVGVAHYVLYLLREPFLGRKINEKHIKETYELAKKDPLFREINTKDCEKEEKDKDNIEDFAQLLSSLRDYLGFDCMLEQILNYVASLFVRLLDICPNALKDTDELAVYLSRCLIFWRLGVLEDNTMLLCLERIRNRITTLSSFNGEEFSKILLVELHNYNFLNLRFPSWIAAALTKILLKDVTDVKSIAGE